MKKFENDLSKGNVVKQLIKFSIPFLISNLIQTLYSVADMVIVGRYAATTSMSGVANGSQVQFMITNMVMGFTVGGTVLVAQYLGIGNRKAMKETISTLFTTLIVVAIVITTLMIFTMDPLLKLIQTPAEAFFETRAYFFVTTLGTIFIFGYNALSAVMRGMGDSKNPLYFVAIACVINIGLDLLLVAKYGMGAGGAAIATVISQAMSMILCIIYLKKNGFIFDFKPSSFKFYKDRFDLLLKIGIPTSAQNAIVSVSFLFLTALANTFGVSASAAVGAVSKLNSFAILPTVAVSASVSAMSAQNIGARQIRRAVQTLKTGIVFSLGISFVIFLIMRIFPEECLSMFGEDKEMIERGVEYLSAISYDYILVPFVFCMNGLFIGAGHTKFSFINSASASLFIRIPACYFLGIFLDKGLYGLGLGAPLASMFGVLMGAIFFFSKKWMRAVIVKE